MLPAIRDGVRLLMCSDKSGARAEFAIMIPAMLSAKATPAFRPSQQ